MGDAQVEELLQQVRTLTSRLQEAETRIRELESDPSAGRAHAAPPAPPAPPARAAPGASARGPSPLGARPTSAPHGGGAAGRARSPRPDGLSRNPVRPGSARASPLRPRMPPQAGAAAGGGGGAFAHLRGGAAPAAIKPATRYFTASMRGGPLTEPLRATRRTFLSPREREDPENRLHGPSLLLRRQLVEQGFELPAVVRAIEQARASGRTVEQGVDVGEEALRILRATKGVRQKENLIEDDNPYNDGVRYWPFRGFAYPPSDYRGPNDWRQTDELGARLELEFVYGYRGDQYRSNLYYTASGKVVYHTAAVGVVYDKDMHAQRFFYGHDDDIVSLAMHPDGVLCATGQVRSLNTPNPRILVWSTESMAALKEIQGFHQRAVICLSFSQDGRRLASIGRDNSHSIAIYESASAGWDGAKPVSKPIGWDKGHNAEIFEMKFNPVTDHIVACGEKYLRFFGLKEAPSANESAIWAKKGIMKTTGRRDGQADVMCLAFGPDGSTYAGTTGGDVYIFHEQTLSRRFAAHAGEVSALWFDTSPGVNRLLSSGSDGLVKAWEVPDDGRAPRTAGSSALRWATQIDGAMHDGVVDLRAFVTPGLEAAAHAIHTSGRNVLVGTVSNEIYELDMGAADGSPLCIMQGHFNPRTTSATRTMGDAPANSELSGIAAHPSAAEVATCGDDRTLRVWDLALKQMVKVRLLKSMGRACGYSPDGTRIAVGLANGGWLVVDADELATIHFVKGGTLRREEISDIKFSPDGSKLAVASHDNFVDLYETASWERYGECKGHSSYITHVDWSHDSAAVQSTCGAYELLYWDASREGHGRQIKSASSMKDVEWATHSCVFGWPVMGIWPEGGDGTDINGIARTNRLYKAAGDRAPWRRYLASADDFGTVRLFHYPCVKKRARYAEARGHSSHVTNVTWTFDDMYVLSTGGGENSIFQWRLVTPDTPVSVRPGVPPSAP